VKKKLLLQISSVQNYKSHLIVPSLARSCYV